MEKSVSKQSDLFFLLKVSKTVYKEAFMEGYLNSAGDQREKYIRNLEKNSKYLRNNAIMVKILSALFIGLMSIIPARTLSLISANLPLIDSSNFGAFLFATTMPITILFATFFIFLFTYGLTSVVGIFSSNTFKWLATFPIKREDINKVIFLTFIKSLDLQLIVMFFSLPVLTAIYLPTILSIIGAFIISSLNILFNVSLLIIISHFMARKVFTVESISTGNSIIRILVSVLYMVTAMTIGVIFNFVYTWISDIFTQSLSIGESANYINQILCFFPWPFSLSYIYAIFLFPINLIGSNFDQIEIILLGFLVSLAIIIRIVRKAFNKLFDITKGEEGRSKTTQSGKILPVAVNIKNPISAIIEKDLKYFLRSFQSMVYILMPIMFPLIGIFSMGGLTINTLDDILQVMIINYIYYGMSVIFLLTAVTNAENDTGGLIYTLPIQINDIYQAKKKIIIRVLMISLILPTIILITTAPSLSVGIFLVLLIQILSLDYTTRFALFWYARMFGKIRNRYTLQMLNFEKKWLKSMIGGVLIFCLLFLPMIISGLITRFGELNNLSFQIQLGISILIWISIKLNEKRLY